MTHARNFLSPGPRAARQLCGGPVHGGACAGGWPSAADARAAVAAGSKKSSSPRRLRQQTLAEIPASMTLLPSSATGSRGPAAFRGRARAGAEPELVRRHVAAALFPDARRRRTGAIPGRAQPLRRLPDRRHRPERRRHAGHDVRCRSRSKSCAARRARAIGANALAGLIKLQTRDATPQQDCACRSELGARLRRGRRASPPAARSAMTARRGAWPASSFPATASSTTSTSIATTRTAATRRRCAASCTWCRPTGWQVDRRRAVRRPRQRLRRVRRSTTPTQHVVGPAGPGCAAHAGRLDENSRRHSLAACEFLSTTAYADSDIVYSFDGDWGNDAYWGDFAPYDYFSRYDRDRSTLSQDLRWQGAAGDAVDWVAGVYATATRRRTRCSTIISRRNCCVSRCAASTRRRTSPPTAKRSGSWRARRSH